MVGSTPVIGVSPGWLRSSSITYSGTCEPHAQLEGAPSPPNPPSRGCRCAHIGPSLVPERPCFYRSHHVNSDVPSPDLLNRATSMSHSSSDAVIDPVLACAHALTFRLGVEFRHPEPDATFAGIGSPGPVPPTRGGFAAARPDRRQLLEVWTAGVRWKRERPRLPRLRERLSWKETGLSLEGISPGSTTARDARSRYVACRSRRTAFRGVHEGLHLTVPDEPTGEPINHFLPLPIRSRSSRASGSAWRASAITVRTNSP